MICDELDEIERKAGTEGKLSMSEIQYIDTLAHAKKNLLKGEEMMGTSHSMARGRNARRDAMGRYASAGEMSRRDMSYYDGSSYADEMSNMVDSIYGIMDDLPQNVKVEAQKFVKKLEQTM
jgi:hypothetical protein